jgi:hypothetical protein
MQGQGRVATINFGFNALASLIPILVHRAEGGQLSGADKHALVNSFALAFLNFGVGAVAQNNPTLAPLAATIDPLIKASVTDFNANGWQEPTMTLVIPPPTPFVAPPSTPAMPPPVAPVPQTPTP